MDESAPAHQSHGQQLEAGVPQTTYPALSPDLNSIQHLWDQLSRHVEGGIPAPGTLTDLRAALQEEWNT